jgi:predicted flap endonuclease-1-like 5' DNA nuclease
LEARAIGQLNGHQMDKVPVTNTTRMPIYVGATMIPAGETRHFNERDVPVHLRPAKAAEPAAPPAADPLAELLGHGVKKIEAQFGELGIGDLEQLAAMEKKSASPRKSLLAAIDEELLNRAIEEEEAAKAAAKG